MDGKEFFSRLALAVYKIDGAYDVFARSGNVKANLMWLLYALNDGRRHTQCGICSEWLFPRTTVNTLVKECKERGFIELKKIAGERREMEIALTEEGKRYADKVLSPVYEAEKALFQEYFREHGFGFLEELESFGEALEKSFSVACLEEK